MGLPWITKDYWQLFLPLGRDSGRLLEWRQFRFRDGGEAVRVQNGEQQGTPTQAKVRPKVSTQMHQPASMPRPLGWMSPVILMSKDHFKQLRSGEQLPERKRPLHELPRMGVLLQRGAANARCSVGGHHKVGACPRNTLL